MILAFCDFTHPDRRKYFYMEGTFVQKEQSHKISILLHKNSNNYTA